MFDAKRPEAQQLLSLDWIAGSQCALSAGLAVTAHWWAARDMALGVGLALALCLQSAAGWILSRRHATLGAWALIAGAAAWITGCAAALEQPALNILLAVPVSAAVSLLGRRASAVALAVCAGIALAQAESAWPAGLTVALLGAIWLLAIGLDHAGRQMREQGNALYKEATRIIAAAQEQEAELRFALEDVARANAQLARLNALTQGLRQAAEEARAEKQQFAAHVSHEMRAPLNIVLGFSNMILESPEAQDGALPPTLRADLTVIQRNAAQLSSLIDDVLDLSQIEAGHLALNRAYTGLDEIIHSVVDLMRGLFESRGLALGVEIEAGLPAVYCDAVRIREVLVNLVNNAWRFTEQGGATIRAQQTAERVRVSVSDTGPGIAPEKAARLFKPFQQADGSIRQRYGGTGLGLAISRQLIELHGGQIGVESNDGTGATFYFELPIHPLRDAQYSFHVGLYEGWEFQQRTRPAAMLPQPARPRVLVVEKGDALQRALQRHLEGAEIAGAPDMEIARASLQQSPAQAVVVNAPSANQGLTEVMQQRWPLDAPITICAFPQHSFDEQTGNTRRLMKPVARQTLARAFAELNVTGGRLLIVDDEPDALHLLERMALSIQPDFRIWLARNGAEAAQLMQHELPDAILLDLVMPESDGWQFLKDREKSAAWAAIPVVVISAQDSSFNLPLTPALAFVTGQGFTTQHLARAVAWLSRLTLRSAAIADPAPEAASRETPA